MKAVLRSGAGTALCRRHGIGIALGVLALAAGATQTQNAIANGDTRTITLHHAHTREDITITFRRNGVYDRAALDKLNWFLRDWRRDEKITMDPRLFDTVWETYREVGSSSAIRVVSAYRSPETNSMLRRRSRGVAKQSQHMMGKAMDLHMPDVSMAKVREIGMRLQRGGVGYYPTAGTPFVHLDVGSVRSWPRMTRPQLERLFPDGRTVHLPADGTPLAGYQLALADIEKHGGTAISYADVTGPRRSLWAILFGGDDDEVEAASSRRGSRQVASRGAPRQTAAAAYTAPTDNGSVFAVQNVALAEQPTEPVTRTNPRARPAAETPAAASPATAAPVRPEPRKAPEAEEGPKLAAIPGPLRRPSDLAFATLAASAIPLPEPRPEAEPAAPVAVAAVTAPAEPAPRPASVPAPTPRPVAFASAGTTLDRTALPSAITGSVPVADKASPALAMVAVPAPLPRPGAREVPAKSAEAATPAARPPVAPGKYAFRLDNAAMNTLIAGVSAEQDKPDRTEKVAMPGVRQSYGTVIVAGRFGTAPAEAGRFTGGLVRPLQAGFVRRGE